MVSDRDRAHFRMIAAAEEELNGDAVRLCAHRSPGANIAAGLALGEFAAEFGADLSRPDEVAPVQLWHALQQKNRESGAGHS